MNYLKKLCILKQLSSGFAEDGKKVSALLTAEMLGGTLTLSLALIGFAPLREGRYVCLLCDEKGVREQFEVVPPSGQLRRKSEALAGKTALDLEGVPRDNLDLKARER